jgi:hypothetical protein
VGSVTPGHYPHSRPLPANPVPNRAVIRKGHATGHTPIRIGTGRRRGHTAHAKTAGIRVHGRYNPQVKLTNVQPGDCPPDRHPLDLRRALEDGEDFGGRGSLRSSAACTGPWYQHGFSTPCPR